MAMKLNALLRFSGEFFALALANSTTNIPTIGPRIDFTPIASPKNEKVSFIKAEGGICICKMLSVGANPFSDKAPLNKNTSRVPSAKVTGINMPAFPRIAENPAPMCLPRDFFRIVDMFFSSIKSVISVAKMSATVKPITHNVQLYYTESTHVGQ